MNVTDLINRIKAKSTAMTKANPLGPISAEPFFTDVDEQRPTPAPYQITDLPEGPGKDQISTLLEMLPPLSLKWGPWLAGGAVRRMMQGRTIDDDGDVDFFFSDASEYLKFEKALSDYEELHASGRAKTYMVNGLKVQIIKRKFYKNLKEVFGDFDFTVCQVATDGKQVAYTQTALEDISENRLRIAPIGRISSLTVVGRLIKYVNHGFIPEAGLFRMIVQSGLDMTSAYKIFDKERPSANYDHDAKVDEIMDAKVFDSHALRKAAAKLGLELPS